MLITPSEFMDFISRVAPLLYWAKFLAFIICITVVIGFIAPKGKRWWIVTLTIMIASAGYIIPDIIKLRERQVIVKKERDKAVSRYQTAKALFDEKCKTAGEKIYRTVDNVEGITLLRVPKPYRNAYAYDPMWEEAAMKQSTEYIISFLGVTFSNYSHGGFFVVRKADNPQEYANHRKPYTDPIFGYTYVDVKEDGSYVRYTLPWGGGIK